MLWYYSSQNQQIGPVDDEALKKLITDGKVNSMTMVWSQGMSNWQPAASTTLSGLFHQSALAVTGAQTPAYNPAYKTPDMEIKELNDLFMWYWICLIGSIFTFGLSAIASIVLFCIILYKCWQQIQDGYARTSPGKAVGFLFIPFYNLYWIFQAYPGFVRDSNAYIQRHGLPVKLQDEGLATAYCVLTLLCLVPYLNVLAGLALFVMQIVLIKNFRDTAVDIIRARK